MLPSVFTENLFDEMFDDMFNNVMPMVAGRRNPLYGKHSKNLMKTDVRETESAYEMDVDLPGFKKEEVQVQLENGYLTISAVKSTETNEDDRKGKYIRRERYAGTMQRSFYVGDVLTQEDIKAKFENGILKVSIPKKDAKAVQEKKTIAIEG